MLDDDDLDGVLAVVTLDEIASTWCRYHEVEHEQFEELGPDWWAIDIFFNSKLFQRPEFYRALLLKLVEHASESVLGNVGAGPLENFVSNDEDDLRWIQTECAKNPKLRTALSGVWCARFVSEANLKLLDAAAGIPLARPNT